MKEEIERRRAEAAEKRQKVEDNTDGEDRPFKCVSPRGSSLKVCTKFLSLFISPPPSSHLTVDHESAALSFSFKSLYKAQMLFHRDQVCGQ